MKILQIVADGNPGGGTTVVLTLVEQLRTQGLNVHFVGQTNSYALATAAGAGAPAHGLAFFPRRINPQTILAMARLLRRERPQLIHAHGARAALNVVLARLLPGTPKVPLVYTVHGYHLGGSKAQFAALGSLAERACHMAALANVFVCGHDRDRGLREGYLTTRDNPQIIYNGIRSEDLPLPGTPDLRSIAFLGRLTAQKNPEILLDIADRLRTDGCRLTLIGGGDLEEKIRRDIARRGLSQVVSVTGSLPRAQALERLRGSGVMVLPSLWEGLPIVLAEAMMMRVPVVASAVSGNPEIVKDRQTGLLVHGQDVDAYVAAIRALTNDVSLRETVIAGGEALVRQEFLAHVMLERHLALYRSMAAKTG